MGQLYHVHEAQQAALRPVSLWARLQAQLWGPGGVGEHLPGASRWSAGCELAHRLLKDYPKPAFGLARVTVGDRERPVVEQVIHTEAFCQLRQFEREGLPASAPTLLLVAPMSGHHATLLRDTVRALVMDHRVIITDWTNVRDVPVAERPFTLTDYVAAVRRFIRLLGASSLHVMAVCQPTVPVLGAIALMAQAGEPVPRSLVLMGGPVDPSANPTAVCDLATQHPLSWFQNQLIHTVPWPYAGFGRQVYPGFMQHMGFVAMNPGRHWKSHEAFFQHLTQGAAIDAAAHRAFYDEYNAVADLPADYYLETVRTVFQEQSLARGTWDIDGVRVNPAAIQGMALLTLEGALDDISAPGQTQAAHGLCSGLVASLHHHRVVEEVGHYGLFSGSRWRSDIAPFIGAFIQNASKPLALLKVAKSVTKRGQA